MSESTVAVDPGNGDLRCGDRIYVGGVGAKTVTDHCPGCDVMEKIDHYTVDERCSGIFHIGSRRTFRLGR